MTVGVVPGDRTELAERVVSAVRESGDAVADGDADDVLAADPEHVVALGEAAVLDLVRTGVSAPLLPVDAGSGLESVPAEAVEPAVERLLAGDWTAVDRPLLSAFVDGDRAAVALADVMVVTTEPARISEYAVRSGAKSVARFRADGAVVATATGSRGYARSAGGPLVEPGIDAVAVVPVAPFATDPDHWVLGLDSPVVLSVERDEGSVSLLADDRQVQEVPPGEPVRIARDGVVRVATVDESQPFF